MRIDVSLYDSESYRRKQPLKNGSSGSPPPLEAVHLFARALAMENRLPEPADLDGALLPPLALFFREDLVVLRTFIAGVDGDWQAAAGTLLRKTENISQA